MDPRIYVFKYPIGRNRAGELRSHTLFMVFSSKGKEEVKRTRGPFDLGAVMNQRKLSTGQQNLT